MYLKVEAGKKYFWSYDKYWSSRRADFENKRSNCLSSQNVDACLADLRAQEINKNNVYNAQIQQANAYMLNGSIITAGALAGRH